MPRSHPPYPTEFKREAVCLARSAALHHEGGGTHHRCGGKGKGEEQGSFVGY
ncbi:MAG: hypothetical protein LC793_12705 [Thermomicrobia bacterium]|nr:hypothetical protein [Thermomicrobia bacterium]